MAKQEQKAKSELDPSLQVINPFFQVFQSQARSGMRGCFKCLAKRSLATRTPKSQDTEGRNLFIDIGSKGMA